MNLGTKRSEIVDTLNSIPGVTGYAKEPNAPRSGDAWPQFTGITVEDGVRYYSWNIFIVLSSNEDAAITWLDDNADELIDALQTPEYPVLSVGHIFSVSTVNLGTPNSPFYGLQITLRD